MNKTKLEKEEILPKASTKELLRILKNIKKGKTDSATLGFDEEDIIDELIEHRVKKTFYVYKMLAIEVHYLDKRFVKKKVIEDGVEIERQELKMRMVALDETTYEQARINVNQPIKGIAAYSDGYDNLYKEGDLKVITTKSNKRDLIKNIYPNGVRRRKKELTFRVLNRDCDFKAYKFHQYRK